MRYVEYQRGGGETLLEQPIIQKSLTEEVYKRIRLAIFQNIFTSGQQLDIQEIARGLGVSRQPVKDAINILAQEGLVEVKQRVGTFVRKITIDDVRKILDARLMFETFAVSNANMTPEKLAKLYELLNRMDHISEKKSFDYLAFNDADIKFHHALVQLAENDVLTNMYRQLNAHYVTARAFYGTAFQTYSTKDDQHRKIVKHLEQGDKEQALSVLESHILRAKKKLLTVFEKMDG